QTLPAEFRIRSEPAQARECLLELSPAAVRVKYESFVCNRLRRYALDEYCATRCRVPIQYLRIGAVQNDRGERRIQGVTIEQTRSQPEAARWIGYVRSVADKNYPAHTIGLCRTLVHAVRRCAFELIGALSRHDRLVHLR